MPPRKKTAFSKTPATRKATPKKSTGKARPAKKAPISVEFIKSENEDEESGFIVDDFDEHEASEYDE
jgi:hypothetical protein